MSEVKILKRKLLLKVCYSWIQVSTSCGPWFRNLPLPCLLLLLSFPVSDKLVLGASKGIVVLTSLISVKRAPLLLCRWQYEGLVANLCKPKSQVEGKSQQATHLPLQSPVPHLPESAGGCFRAGPGPTTFRKLLNFPTWPLPEEHLRSSPFTVTCRLCPVLTVSCTCRPMCVSGP